MIENHATSVIQVVYSADADVKSVWACIIGQGASTRISDAIN